MTTQLFVPGRAFLRSVLFLSTTLLAFGAPPRFEIPAGPAPAALDLFIQHPGAQVIYLRADVQDIQTNPVSGQFEPKAALDLLLQNTQLTCSERKAGQFTVAGSNPARSTAASATRAAIPSRA